MSTDDLTPTEYFSVRELLWLPSLDRLANEADGLNEVIWHRLTDFATGPLLRVREAIGKPFAVHCFYRPPAYNALVKGAPNSAHQCLGPWAAVDFDVPGMTCDDVRSLIIDKGWLDEFGLRMEWRPGSGWVHLDSRTPGVSGRYFRP